MPKLIMRIRRQEAGLFVTANYELPNPPVPGLRGSSSFNLENPDEVESLVIKLGLIALIPQIVSQLRSQPASPRPMEGAVPKATIPKTAEDLEAEALSRKLFGEIIFMRSLIRRSLEEYNLEDVNQYVTLFMSTLIKAFQEEGVGIVWQE